MIGPTYAQVIQEKRDHFYDAFLVAKDPEDRAALWIEYRVGVLAEYAAQVAESCIGIPIRYYAHSLG